MTKSFAVIGLGRFGTSVAKTLSLMGHDVLAIDTDEERVQEVIDCVTHAVQVDALEEAALKSLGIRNFDVVIVAIGADIQASILTTVILKELGVKFVVAKAQNELHGKVLEKTGADRVVYPERDMGVRVAHHLVSTNVLDYIELSPNYSILEAVAPVDFIGRTLADIDLRAKYHVTLVAIKRGQDIIVAPLAEDVIQEGDILVTIGANKDLQNLER